MSTYAPPSPDITAGMIESLRQTKPWVRLMSILGFVGAGFMVLLGLFMILAGVVGGTMSRSMGGALGGAPMLFMGVLYLLLAALYVYPSLLLFRYASAIGRALGGETVSGVEDALEAQKSFWKFLGITALIVLVLYAVLFVVLIVAGVFSAMHH
jgi:Family of unknown function (DUF5362)